MLTGEQCLALLPPEAPRSQSIFETGFYFINGRGIRFRHALLTLLVPPWPALLHVIFIIVRVFCLFAAFVFFNTGDLRGAAVSLLIGFFDFALCALYVFIGLLHTPLQPCFDINKRVIRHGFSHETMFESIHEIHIQKTVRSDSRTRGLGTEIHLNTTPSWFSSNNPSIHVATFARHRFWEEERLVEMFKDALLRILGRDVDVRYTVDDELIKVEAAANGEKER